MKSMEYTETSLSTSMKSTVSTPVVTTSQSNTPILVSSTTTTSTVSTSMNSTVSTPVVTPSQSTGSNTLIIAAVNSTVFILLVVTILVILIVSILVCRRNQFGTSYTNSDSERVADEQRQGN